MLLPLISAVSHFFVIFFPYNCGYQNVHWISYFMSITCPMSTGATWLAYDTLLSNIMQFMSSVWAIPQLTHIIQMDLITVVTICFGYHLQLSYSTSAFYAWWSRPSGCYSGFYRTNASVTNTLRVRDWFGVKRGQWVKITPFPPQSMW